MLLGVSERRTGVVEGEEEGGRGKESVGVPRREIRDEREKGRIGLWFGREERQSKGVQNKETMRRN